MKLPSSAAEDHAAALKATVHEGAPGCPDTTVSVRQVFGIDSELRVPAFSRADEHVHPLDAAGLALQVAGGSVMALVRPGRDPHPLAGAIPHLPSLASSSPGASTPFSVRIVSTE